MRKSYRWIALAGVLLLLLAGAGCTAMKLLSGFAFAYGSMKDGVAIALTITLNSQDSEPALPTPREFAESIVFHANPQLVRTKWDPEE